MTARTVARAAEKRDLLGVENLIGRMAARWAPAAARPRKRREGGDRMKIQTDVKAGLKAERVQLDPNGGGG